MSDIKTGGAAATALAWIEEHIRARGLAAGDHLPGELEIAAQLGLARSSVREALGALKTLGLIESRRKGGIRLLRDPVLLELRHYFASHLDRSRQTEAMEFRAVMEWGLGPLLFRKTDAATLRTLRGIVAAIEDAPEPTWEKVVDAEIRFHTALTASCGNRLAMLFAHLYQPLFASLQSGAMTAAETSQWVDEHRSLVEPLARRDEAAFLAALRSHTHGYMRLPGRRGT